ncbi:hypothetical protein UNDKW_4042 [Undibacterium sp. KW1]|nr:hypothetical protein UNDKW_4042 [Undibacterium sp. KW1]
MAVLINAARAAIGSIVGIGYAVVFPGLVNYCRVRVGKQYFATIARQRANNSTVLVVSSI